MACVIAELSAIRASAFLSSQAPAVWHSTRQALPAANQAILLQTSSARAFGFRDASGTWRLSDGRPVLEPVLFWATMD
jgi:hypothetical protein